MFVKNTNGTNLLVELINLILVIEKILYITQRLFTHCFSSSIDCKYVKVFFLINCILLTVVVAAQYKKLSIAIRVPVQFEFQKETLERVPISVPKEQKNTALNYGFEILAQKEFCKKLSAHFGTGFFRNRFNFKRFYDHRLLNVGIDSIPIGTSTTNYIYNLLRIPIGLSLKINRKEKSMYKVGAEVIFNYSFQKIYNGGKPFPDASKTLSDFQYSGNSINLFACIEMPITNFGFLELGPYIRVVHTYKKDEVLYENPKEQISNIFGAFGLSIKYSFSFKKQ